MKNGTLYFVSPHPADHPSRPPALEYVLSAPPGEDGSRLGPSEEDFRFLSPREAKEVLGGVAVRLAGTSVSRLGKGFEGWVGMRADTGEVVVFRFC